MCARCLVRANEDNDAYDDAYDGPIVDHLLRDARFAY